MTERARKVNRVGAAEAPPPTDRLVSTHIDYIAQPGHNITKKKISKMNELTTGFAELVAESAGLDVVNVDTQRY